uniref:Tox-SGS domain-containing protein n=1 Tax=Anopheles minimus TaxID=112268 RepID=A0A182W8Z8_9DIPT
MAKTNRLLEHYSMQLPAHLVTKARVHDTIEVKKVPNASTLFVRINRDLLIYELSQENYEEVHRRNDFFAIANKNANYPWDVYEPSTLIVRNAKGVEVYQWENRQLALQYRISNYHDQSGYGSSENTFLFGKIFPSEEHIGIVSRLGYNVQFRSIVLNKSKSGIKALKKTPILKEVWKTPTSSISLVKHLDSNPQLTIALRTKEELKLFRFDDQYALKLLMTIQDFPPMDSEYDRIIFAKFNQTQYNDLLHLSTNGLQIYRFNESATAFHKIYYSTAFSKLRGWDSESVEAVTAVKFDADEYDDMVYSGPQGLGILRAHATSAGFEFHNVFHETVANQTLRYSFLKLIQNQAPSNNLELLLHTSNGLVRVKTKHLSTDEVAKPIDESKSGKPMVEKEPVTIPEIVANSYHAGWWHDQLDFSTVLQPINPYNGDVELLLPIVNIPGPFGIPIRKIIQYKNIEYNNELGRGWSFPLDYIALDRQNSAFVQDHVYSLVKENQRIILMHQPNKTQNEPSQSELMSFTIDGYPDIQIVLDVKRNFWKVTIDNRIMTYIALSKFQTSTACPMWPLCGSQSRQTQTYSSQWFLNQEEVASTKHKAYYFYELINNKTDVRLTSIALSDDAQIELSYSEDRITHLSVLALQFAQHFTFHYSDNKQFLQAIKQSNHSLFDFEYDTKMRLSKIVYPNGAKWTPEYTNIPINPTSLMKTIPIDFDASIYYGPDYVVIVDANLTDGRLVLHFRDPLGARGSSKTDSTETIYTLNGIKRYVVHAIENLIAVVVIFDSSKTVAILHFANDSWQHPKYYNQFPLDGFVTAGNTFLLLSDLKSLRLVTTTGDQQYSDVELRQNLPANFAVKAFPHGYATYEQKLEIFLLQENGKWFQIQTNAEKVNFFDEINNFVSSFAIKSDLRQTIRKGLVADMLGSYKQAIILKAPVLRNGVLEIYVRFFMLDLNKKPQIHDYYTTKIPYAEMSKFNYTVSNEEKDRFTVGYQLVNNKYELVVKKSSGPHAAALNKYLAEAKQRMAQHYKGSKEWNNIWNEAKKTTREESQRIYKSVKDAIVFAIDLSQFGLLTNQDGVLTGNHQITYDGLHWNKRHLDEDTIRLRKVNQSLSAEYRLVKADAQDTFKIVSVANGTTVFDTNTTKSEEIQLVVPHYVQTQPKDNPLSVYFFDSKETVTFPAEEMLNRASNQIAIITTSYAKSIAQALLFRCAKYFLNPNITVLGSQTIASMDETAHVTQYIFHAQDLQLSVDGAMFRKMKIAPGADRSRFGWYEQSVDLGTGKTVRKAYTADGQGVLDRKLRDQEAKRRQSEKHTVPKRSDLERMILDMNERVSVVDLGPYRLVDEMVSYYGFELYEKNHFGKDKTWSFNETLLKTEHNNRFLSLKTSKDKLTGEFMPLEPNMMFVVSCWLRTSVPVKLGDAVDVLNVDVMVEQETKRIMSSEKVEIKQRIGTWSYVETIIDTTHFPNQKQLRFVVTLAPTTAHPSIDIDHVRFSPLSMPFEAKIYESGRGEVSALLSTSGLMKQYFYNGKGKKTVVFSEHGMVEQFVTDSKVLYTRQSNRRPCVIEMKPKKSGWFGRNGLFGISHSGGSISKTFTGTWSTLALRFLYNIPSNDGALRFVWQNKEFPLPCAPNSSCPPLPQRGEILIFLTPVRVSAWVDGVLTQETLLEHFAPDVERIFKLHLTARTQIHEFIEMYDPSVKVTYHSLSGQPTQVVVYESHNTTLVREILYDEIERPVLQTKWTKVNNEADARMFYYYDDFIQTFDNSSLELTGLVAKLNPTCQGFPYTHTIYGKDPTENKLMQGLPGKDYTINGKYKRAYTHVPHNFILSSLFPEEEGFHHQAVHLPGGAVRVAIDNEVGEKVAKFSKVGNYEHRLTTWRYGSNNKLQQELPPMYHYLAQTSTTMDRDSFFGANYTTEQRALQQQWEARYDYDDANRLIRKRTPDGGIFQYIYDEQGILRFSLHKDHNETLDRVIHFTYVAHDKITREALVQLNETECRMLANSGNAPNATNFIDTLYGEYDNDPNMRYQSKFSSRRIDDDQMTEFLVFDESKKILKKVFVVNTINTSYSIDYEYQNDKLRSIKYPIGAGDNPYMFIYDRNGHGDITSIRESAMREPMFEFTYNADSLMETMKVRTDGKHMFQRNFTYNEPGFLVQLNDEYLSESVSYLETDSYGQDSYTPIYEGLISKTLFTAHWRNMTSPLRNGIFPEYFITASMKRRRAALCNEVLRGAGYIDEYNLVKKTFYGEQDDDLPFVCGERFAMKHLSRVLSSNSFPYQYGHRYDYDDHDQLIKAKYFHGLDELALSPLTHRSFSKAIKDVDGAKSAKIWDALRTNSFLTMDCTNPNLCHGREGTKSIFSDFIRQHRYSHHLKTMLSKAIAARKGLNMSEFEQKCKRWIVGSNMVMKMCTQLQQSLSSEKIIGDSVENPLAALNSEFKDALKQFENLIPDIVGVLHRHFATVLGSSAADVQSYEIDANGNHRKFYTGFSRYRLEYGPGTNKITKVFRQQFDRVQRNEEKFNMEHDSDGAVIKAEHKGIKHMEYDKLLHRVSKIEMMDERTIVYQYDVRGERTFKQVRDKNRSVISEKYYLRDANGLVLMDMDMTYLAKDQPPDVRVTSYIYKDQQLIGFLRNDKLYGVITDHEGSVRLVVTGGEVVAAYDYLPYGQIFRRFGTDLDGQLSYLYTGQEWEPETGLYNYRARLYDADIGRFYQMDPKEQYPSPYVYAGNSPVSLVDPDGELAFAISCIIMAIIGAYIGASSAAKSWNPLEWNWKSKSLWLGMIGGALTGLSIPYNLTASIAYFVGMGLSLSASIGIMIGAGITFGYFAMAAASGSWDPRNFDMSSPGTWNALLGGIATSAFIVTNPNSLINTFRSISSTFGRALFVVTHVAITVSFTYLLGALKMGGEFDVRKWDFTDPGLYYGMFDAYITASFTTTFARNLPGLVKKYGRKIETGLDRLAETEVYFRAKRLMRGDWSTKLSNARHFMAANAQAIGNLQRGIIPIAFYTFFVTLRMADSYEKSAIPGFSVFLQMLQTAVMTRGFTNRVVKPLMPTKANAPLALRLEAVPLHDNTFARYGSSGADCLGSFFRRYLRIPFEKLFYTHHEQYSSASTIDNYKDHYRQTSKHGTIENCHRMSHGNGNERIYVTCYSHRSVITIYPKDDAMRDTYDRYRHCVPLTFNGMPAISCDGQRSTLLAVQLEPPRMFEYVDGWLLLARVAPAAVREVKRIFRSLFGLGRNANCKTQQPLEKRTGVRKSMKQTIAGLQHLYGKSLTNGWKMDWFGSMLKDVEEDVHEYLQNGYGNVEILLERLAALHSDAKEEIEMHEAKMVLGQWSQFKNINLAGNAGATLSCDQLIPTSDTFSCYARSADFNPLSI